MGFKIGDIKRAQKDITFHNRTLARVFLTRCPGGSHFASRGTRSPSESNIRQKRHCQPGVERGAHVQRSLRAAGTTGVAGACGGHGSVGARTAAGWDLLRRAPRGHPGYPLETDDAAAHFPCGHVALSLPALNTMGVPGYPFKIQ